ncbi:uncharacterized protein im:7136021 [Puntigrus tetrazona]|uniref:uncharacterized protein im:7136021 n=1 Tax=Puntigrus tetrazona TaxID=1606681 RepID=UPI001C8AD6F0|nr:uncharacterized protein im:7136021 [Puntigrus tetrazona]
MPEIQLPEEMWIHVFGFLSERDKLNVRLSCAYFKRLVDHWSLWKDSVVVLQKPYDSHFWKTLRQRKIKSVVVKRATTKVLQQTVAWLPWIGSVTLLECNDGTALVTLTALKHLQRLVISQCCCRSLTGSLLSLRQLTHLCLCEVKRASVSEIRAAISQLVNLTTLEYHDDKNPIHKSALHGMLGHLPNLKHLSLKLGPKYGILPDDYFCPTKANGNPGVTPDAELGLSSLELLNYEDPCLSSLAFNGLSSLTKLAVHYRKCYKNPDLCCLTKWLRRLNVLSELSVSLGYPLEAYAEWIPRTVQRLSLMRVQATLNSVRIVGEQVPDLLQLQLDLFCLDICDLITEVPHVFPKVQILEVRHHNVPESVFLQLQRLPRLEQLVILDAPESPSPTVRNLTQKLHVQTNNRIHVLHSNSKDQTACSCGFFYL